MFPTIALPILFSLIAGASAIPTYHASEVASRDLNVSSSNLFVRAASAPPACAKSKKRAVLVSGSIAKRIAQLDLPDVAQSWEDLCLKSGGDIKTNDPCVTLAGQNGINALLASGKPCDQLDNADAMITFAKSRGVKNKKALIENAIGYMKHPRNALNEGGITPSTLYCQNVPKNAELIGVVNAQLDGVDPGLFGGPKSPLVAFGAPGTCPRGQKPDLETCTCTGKPQ